MKNNGAHKAHPSKSHGKRETVLTVPDDSADAQLEQKEKALAEDPAQAPPTPAINGSVPVSER